MRTIFEGIRIEEDDAIILSLMKKEGILPTWEHLRTISDKARIMFHKTNLPVQFWVIQEFVNGLSLTVIDAEKMKDPKVLQMFEILGKQFGWDLDNLLFFEVPKDARGEN